MPPPAEVLPDIQGDAAMGKAQRGLGHDGIEGQDWDRLLDAVKTKLWQLATDLPQTLTGTRRRTVTTRLRESVLECVAALDELHATRTDDSLRRRRLELEVSESLAALAQANAELIESRADERRARFEAWHDSLTTLPNRTHFRARLELGLADAAPNREPLALMYLDLDGFKRINDTHGHDTGDKLLRIVAARMLRTVRAEDVVSRLGGDEFACLLVGVPDRSHLSQLACKVFEAVSAPLTIGPLTLSVRPSIGIATFPGDGDTVEALLKVADAAMYRAKRQRTGYAFSDQPAEE